MFRVRVALAILITLGTFLPQGKTQEAKTPPKTLSNEMARIAKELVKLLAEEKQDSLAIGEFPGPAQLDSNFSLGIEKSLTEQLTKLNVKVNKTAELSVRGRYARVEVPEKKEIAIKLTVQVFDKNDEEKAGFKAVAEVTDTAQIAQMLGVTVSLPANGREERLKKVAEASDFRKPAEERPKPRIDDGKVAPPSDLPPGEDLHAMQLLLKKTFDGPVEPLDAKLENGQPTVKIQRGEFYEVKLFNRSARDTAVTLTVDGLDIFSFSQVKHPKTGQNLRYYFVPANSSVVIKGWFKNFEQADSFFITSLDKAAVSIGPSKTPGKVGVVTATFLDVKVGTERSAGDTDATGIGPPVEMKTEAVEKTVGSELAIISIRYSR